MIRALLILGPTASGKSALALALAAELGGEIVNADSMQIYADLRVLTARPTVEETARAPHHLYGFVDAAQRFSVGAWLAAAKATLADIAARRKPAIVVGGTGLYFKALIEGLAATPPIPPAVRDDLLNDLAQHGAPALHARLAARDPAAAAALQPNDGPRILRALEVLSVSGESILAWRARHDPPVLPAGSWRGLALAPPRAALYAAINARFDAMLAAGALDEARTLAARGLDPQLPCMKAHGAPALMAHLRGEISLARAAEIAAQDTRNYAKRQFTWLRGQAPDWPRVEAVGLSDRIAAALVTARAG
jgi:tRNA dimethylallyltransferase